MIKAKTTLSLSIFRELIDSIRVQFPEFFKHCSGIHRLEEIDYYEDITNIFVPRYDALLYIISKKSHYPHTPDFETFLKITRNKQGLGYRKYTIGLKKHIFDNPEVTKFCLL